VSVSWPSAGPNEARGPAHQIVVGRDRSELRVTSASVTVFGLGSSFLRDGGRPPRAHKKRRRGKSEPQCPFNVTDVSTWRDASHSELRSARSAPRNLRLNCASKVLRLRFPWLAKNAIPVNKRSYPNGSILSKRATAAIVRRALGAPLFVSLTFDDAASAGTVDGCWRYWSS